MGVQSWRSGKDFAINIIIFGVYKSSSFHVDNCQNNPLILGEKPTDDIDGSLIISLRKIQNFA